MNKAYGIAALAGFLGLSAANPAILSAQGNNEPIKFGQNRDLTYQIVNNRFADAATYLGIVRRNIPTGLEKNQGYLFFDENGNFTVWGGLSGNLFWYQERPKGNYNKLFVGNNSVNMAFEDDPATTGIQDTVSVNSDTHVFVPWFFESSFFESHGNPPVPETSEYRAKLGMWDTFRAYVEGLNLNGVREWVAAQTKKQPPDGKELEAVIKSLKPR